ncbi:hypothetical protein BGZ61DRAFT_479491 [Ilyonectria robusta]|uniref:uncharacterized protein n=1 Tax=Ilyonectria robusta TaxID=1079257 RepID=UPI001E8DCC27|nr:uncharacterized protein BGZ61DRAFT_479491 [Ilyonectria robusta]KAH8686382.1 hypothetical protein BGZ61DRAFT_479491 [Ilyonectria robusta]
MKSVLVAFVFLINTGISAPLPTNTPALVADPDGPFGHIPGPPVIPPTIPVPPHEPLIPAPLPTPPIQSPYPSPIPAPPPGTPTSGLPLLPPIPTPILDPFDPPRRLVRNLKERDDMGSIFNATELGISVSGKIRETKIHIRDERSEKRQLATTH